MDDYGTESGNPDNVKGVDFIAVEAPSPLLRDGLILVDTPGVGGLFMKHRDITYRHAPRADAIFFVTDMNAPIGAAEVAFLKELRPITNLIYFVQTKAKTVDADARRERMENNVTILTEKAGFARKSIRYFVIDSKFKADADQANDFKKCEASGFEPLMKFLNDELKGRKDLNLASVGLRRARERFENIRIEAMRKRDIMAADTSEKQQKLTDEQSAAQKALSHWGHSTFPALMNEFRESLLAATIDLKTELQAKLRPGGSISETITMKVEASLKNGPMDAKQLYELAPQFIQEARATASKCLIDLIKRLENVVSDLLQALATKAGAQIADTLMLDKAIKTFANCGTLSLNEIILSPPDSDLFAKMRPVLLGAAGGYGIASIVGATIGSVFPFVGTLFGGMAGHLIATFFMGKMTFDQVGKQEVIGMQRAVFSAVEKDLSKMHLHAVSEFDKASQIVQLKASEAIQQIISQGKHRLTVSLEEIVARKNVNGATLRQEETIVQALEMKIAEIGKQLSAAESAVNA